MSDQILVGPLLARYSPTVSYLWFSAPGFYPKESLLRALPGDEIASFVAQKQRSSLVLDLSEASSVGTEVLEFCAGEGRAFWAGLKVRQVAVVLPDDVFAMLKGLFLLWAGEKEGVDLRFFAGEQFRQGWDVVEWLSPEP